MSTTDDRVRSGLRTIARDAAADVDSGVARRDVDEPSRR